MAVGLQFKENLSIISGGYPGEGVGSDGVIQDWTDTSGDSGSHTVTYYYHDSTLQTDANSTIVRVTITDEWSAVKNNDNSYDVTVRSVINSITRTVVGSPAAYSVSMFARRYAGGPNMWTSGGCVNAAANATHATNVDLGTFTIHLPPGQETVTHGTVYFRSNTCGHDGDGPGAYVDEFWMGINFRNTLPPDYRPGDTYDNNAWWSHNRSSGWAGVWDGGAFKEMRTESGDGVVSGNPPYIYNGSNWVNQRKIGNE